MKCPWANSPHKDLIDRLICDYIANYENWRHSKQSSDDIPFAVWRHARNSVSSITKTSTVYDYLLAHNHNVSKHPGEICDVIFALLKYPDSVYMLECDISELVLLSRLGNIPATLLYVGADAIKRTGFKVIQDEKS